MAERPEGDLNPQRPARRRRGGRLILIVLGSLVGLLLLAVVGGLLAPENVVNSRKDAELAKLSAQLGRPVTAGQGRRQGADRRPGGGEQRGGRAGSEASPASPTPW